MTSTHHFINSSKQILTKQLASYALIFAFLLFNGCQNKEEAQNEIPLCTIISPISDSNINSGDIAIINVMAEDIDGNISELTVFIDGIKKSTFTDTPYTYNWDTEHESIGNHTITATCIDDKGMSNSHEVVVNIVEIITLPEAIFTASTTNGTSPLTISFYDSSTYSPHNWQWDFGDGNASTEQNPTYVYNEPGQFTVSLTVSNNDGSDSETKTNFIVVVCPSNIIDFDGNVYNSVQVGAQCWMTENLKTTHYPNGEAIPNITNNVEWGNLLDNNTDDAYSYIDNSTAIGDVYGALYTWSAAMGDNAISSSDNPSGIQGICPTGWHLPSDDEWKQMEIHLGMSQEEADATDYRGIDEGSKIAGNSELWEWGSLVNNAYFMDSGINALPGANRTNESGSFNEVGYWGYWWTSTIKDSTSVWCRKLSYQKSKIIRYNYFMSNGLSVRCVQD